MESSAVAVAVPGPPNESYNGSVDQEPGGLLAFMPNATSVRFDTRILTAVGSVIETLTGVRFCARAIPQTRANAMKVEDDIRIRKLHVAL
jgi:hypothetical protein